MLKRIIENWVYVFLVYSFLYLFLLLFKLIDFELAEIIDKDSFFVLKDRDYLIILLSFFFNQFSIFTISIFIYLGFYLNNISISFKSILVLNFISNLIFFIPTILEPLLNVENLKEEFSFFSLIPIERVSPWLKVMLISINVFEIIYVVIFSLLLSKLLNIIMDLSFKIVLIFYSGIYILWLILFMFISIN